MQRPSNYCTFPGQSKRYYHYPTSSFFSPLHAFLCLIRRQFYCRGRDRLCWSCYTLFCALVLPTVKRIVHTADRFLHGSLSASLACACFLETYQPDCGSAVHYVYISSHSMQKTAEEHAVNLHRIVYFRALFWTWTSWTLKHLDEDVNSNNSRLTLRQLKPHHRKTYGGLGLDACCIDVEIELESIDGRGSDKPVSDPGGGSAAA